MNIKVITRHTPSNYGSLLQSIATIKAIESLGHHCEIIDYWKQNEVGLQGIITSLKQKPSWYNNYIKRLIYIFLRYPGEMIALHRFNKMRAEHLNLSKRCFSKNDLEKLQADIFMTGSDQVWGPLLDGKFDDAYFLNFVKESDKKIAYAGSFGRTEFTNVIIKQYKDLLSKYKYISVRESSAVKLLDQWGINCQGQVLDPTLLMDSTFWNNLIEKDIEGDYVLIYEIHNNPQLDSYAKRFAKNVGLPLIRISPTLHQISRGGKMIFCPNVSTFLSYIKNAKYMLTDSFHGTAFAINFNTQFIEVLPNTKTGARNQSILELTGLQNRIVTNFDDFSISNQMINYTPVNEIIQKEREKSYSILQKIIEQ